MRNTFQTVNGRGLDHESLPMKLWQKAKKYGIWNPRDIDFSQDAADWRGLSEQEQDVIYRLTSLFQAGEESVTLDLLPLIMVIAKEGRLEEEMFLTSFLWEEAKHVEGFNRFMLEVWGEVPDLTHYHTENYKHIFYDELPNTLSNLLTDHSPVAQARASVTYNMIVEGVLAETGYYAYHKALKENKLFPGTLEFVGKLKQDESRHIAYGIYLLSRLVSEHGDEVWEAIEERMDDLLDPAIGFITESLLVYEVIPFGVQLDDLVNYAMGQFQKRMARLEKARTQSLQEIQMETLAAEVIG